MAFEVRIKCTPDDTDPATWHYWRETQTVLDDTIACGDHPTGDTVEFFTVESEDE